MICQGESSPMLKPLTLSVSLALALGACGVSMAGPPDNQGCADCGLAGPGPGYANPSPQGFASPQGGGGAVAGAVAGGQNCGPKHKLCGFLHHEKCYTYQWVQKK